MTVTNSIHFRRSLFVSAVAALAALAMQSSAAASGTASISGGSLVYAGDGAGEDVHIGKEFVNDPNGEPVGFVSGAEATETTRSPRRVAATVSRAAGGMTSWSGARDATRSTAARVATGSTPAMGGVTTSTAEAAGTR